MNWLGCGQKFRFLLSDSNSVLVNFVFDRFTTAPFGSDNVLVMFRNCFLIQRWPLLFVRVLETLCSTLPCPGLCFRRQLLGFLECDSFGFLLHSFWYCFLVFVTTSLLDGYCCFDHCSSEQTVLCCLLPQHNFVFAEYYLCVWCFCFCSGSSFLGLQDHLPLGSCSVGVTCT